MQVKVVVCKGLITGTELKKVTCYLYYTRVAPEAISKGSGQIQKEVHGN